MLILPPAAFGFSRIVVVKKGTDPSPQGRPAELYLVDVKFLQILGRVQRLVVDDA